ncbi:unnamed protein product, partial [Iphiclides podalirius]
MTVYTNTIMTAWESHNNSTVVHSQVTVQFHNIKHKIIPQYCFRMKTSVKNNIMKRKHKSKIGGEAVASVNVSKEGCKGEIKDEKSEQNTLNPITELVIKKSKSSEDTNKYPILDDKNFILKIHSVPLTNNQKGRIRQVLKDSLRGTSDFLLPDIIHNKIQTILKSSENFTDSDLRKMRILFNMLKTALQNKDLEIKPRKENGSKELQKKVKVKEGLNVKKEVNIHLESNQKEKKDVPKKKGPKRYVVFVGNLPMDIDKEKIMQHFADFKNFIKDVRLPKQKKGKSAIAYVELENETIYELALSKHHSMLGNRRINVLYTAQKNGKITTTEAKSKTAKLLALQKSGKLIGSVPMNKKRSQRRLKMKQAQAKLAAESA